MIYEELLNQLIPYRKIKHTYVNQYAVSTLRETATDVYETAIINPTRIYVVYSGPSRFGALWAHWKARRKLKRGMYSFPVLGWGELADDHDITLGRTRTMRVDKQSKKASVIDLKDYK